MASTRSESGRVRGSYEARRHEPRRVHPEHQRLAMMKDRVEIAKASGLAWRAYRLEGFAPRIHDLFDSINKQGDRSFAGLNKDEARTQVVL